MEAGGGRVGIGEWIREDGLDLQSRGVSQMVTAQIGDLQVRAVRKAPDGSQSQAIRPIEAMYLCVKGSPLMSWMEGLGRALHDASSRRRQRSHTCRTNDAMPALKKIANIYQKTKGKQRETFLSTMSTHCNIVKRTYKKTEM